MARAGTKNTTVQSDSSLSVTSDGPFSSEQYGNKSPKTPGSLAPSLSPLIEGISTTNVSNSGGSYASFQVANESDKRFCIDAKQHLSNDTIAAMANCGIKERPSMTTVVADTKRTAQEICSRTEMDGSRFVYKIDSENMPILETKLIEYPDLKTTVAVVAGDTYDEALNMYKLKTDTDLMPVYVLNFANAYKPGGGWLIGAQAQEEQLCYRSTLAGTLDERLYPLKHEEVFYSPHVIVYRGNNAKGYRFMDKHFVVSVVSMAAINGPTLTPDNSTYLNKIDREIMISRMRTVLRTAGQNNHRRLALGPVGCGVFENPPQAVADCWKSVLLEKEFHGWFERIHFIIKDRHGSNNFEPFKKTLDGLSM